MGVNKEGGRVLRFGSDGVQECGFVVHKEFCALYRISGAAALPKDLEIGLPCNRLWCIRAGDRIRTGDVQLGKLAFYR